MTTTWNPSDKDAGMTLSNGNLTTTRGIGGSSFRSVRATDSQSSGKWYYEVQLDGTFNAATQSGEVGVSDSVTSLGGDAGQSSTAWVITTEQAKYHGGSYVVIGSNCSSNDILQVAWDAGAGKIWFGVNNSWLASGNPSAGTNPVFTSVTGTLFPICCASTNAVTMAFTARFGSGSAVTYTPPTGFTEWGGANAVTGTMAVNETQDTSAIGVTVIVPTGSFALTETQDTSTINMTTPVLYTTWNPSDIGGAAYLYNSNLSISTTTPSTTGNGRGTLPKASGKWYFEHTITAGPSTQTIGVATTAVSIGNTSGLFSTTAGWGYSGNGSKQTNNTQTAYGTAAVINDVIGVAVDVDAGKIWFSLNGTWQASGDPAAGTNAAFTSVAGNVYPAWTGAEIGGSGNPSENVNFGSASFSHSPPSGFSAWGGLQTVVVTFAFTDTQDTSSFSLSGSADATISVTDTQDTSSFSGAAANTTEAIIVSVGNTGTIISSLDGAAWTASTSGTALNLNGVCQGGSGGNWVVVGNSGVILTSPNVVTWSIVGSGTTQPLNDVAFGAGKYVIVGGAGIILTSSDGNTWTGRTSGTSASLVAVHFANSQFVAVGGTAIRYSADGITWSSGGSTSPAVTLYDVNYSSAESLWMVSGLSRIFSSTTGQGSWTSRHTVTGSIPVSGLAWDDTHSLWLGVGGNRRILTSSNGTSWSENTSLASTTSSFNKAVWDGGQFIIVGNRQGTSPNVYTSPDESTFTHQTVPTSVIYTGIAVGDTPVIPSAHNYGNLIVTDTADTFSGTGTVDTGFTVTASFDVTEPQDIFAGFEASTTIAGSIVAIETQDTAAFSENGNTMTIRMLQDSFDNIVTYGAFLFNGGLLNIYTGAQPIDPIHAATGVMVASITLPNPAFVEADDGVCVKTGDWSGSATNSGVAGWFRLTGTAGDIIDGTVTTALGSGDLLASTTNFTVGDPVEVTSCHFEFQQP